MPYKTEKLMLGLFFDRRVKLLPCQKELIKQLYSTGVWPQRQLAKKFKVSRRLISFVLFPERLQKNLEDRKIRGGSNIYYERESHNEAVNNYRRFKHSKLKDY